MREESLYREVLLERLTYPINQGVLEKPDRKARLVNPLCGDEVILYLQIRNNIIDKALYSGTGCAISQVSASFLAENIQGKNIEKIKKISQKDLINLLGINPGPSRLKCALLSFEVLQETLK